MSGYSVYAGNNEHIGRYNSKDDAINVAEQVAQSPRWKSYKLVPRSKQARTGIFEYVAPEKHISADKGEA